MHWMIADESRPLAEFAAEPDAVIRALRANGQPLTLTVEGRPSVVVQDASAFGAMLDRLERLETIAPIRAGLAQVAAGKTRAAAEVLDEIARKHGIAASDDECW